MSVCAPSLVARQPSWCYLDTIRARCKKARKLQRTSTTIMAVALRQLRGGS